MSRDYEIDISLDNNIYNTWGLNKIRRDFPAFGPEYKAWKKIIPSDVQKILLDYITARQIWRSGGLGRSVLDRDLVDHQPFPVENYSQLREEVLNETNKVADLVGPFLRKNYPALIPDVLAVGLDGSALYRPKPYSDIDVWILFKYYKKIAEQATRKLQQQLANSTNYRVDLRPINDEVLLENGLMQDIHSLLMPHKVLRYFLPYNEVTHQERILELVGLARKSKANIYRAARMLVAIAK